MTAAGLDAVVFDWGGTLSLHADVELADLWRAAARRLADGDTEREDRLTALLVDVEAASWARATTTRRSTRLMDLLREASDALDLDVAEAVLDEAGQHHLDAWTPSIHHDPQAAAVLAGLRERGLAIGLLSNTHWPRSFHEHFLERDGLADLIAVRCYTCELDWMKPHPAAFHAVAERLGVDPRRCAFVGDRPLDDISGALGAGMRAVWRVNPALPFHTDDADAVIHTLPELLPHVDRWLSRLEAG